MLERNIMATVAKSRLTAKRVSQPKVKSKTAKKPKNGDEIWDELLATPESDAFLKALSEQVHEDYLSGNTEPGGFGGDDD
jgi:hypothetical protein